MRCFDRMMGYAMLFAVGAIVGCSDGGGGGGGGTDTMTVTIDGMTTVYTENGTNPQIGADEAAGTSVVGLAFDANAYIVTIIFVGVTEGDYVIGTGVPPTSVMIQGSSLPGVYGGTSGTVTITSYGGPGSPIVGEIPDLVLGFSGDSDPHPASISFSVKQDT